MSTNTVQTAPWGSSGIGKVWNFEAPAGGGIKKISIRHGDAVDALSFVPVDRHGIEQERSETFGGGGGRETKDVELNWPEEYLTAISGTYGNYTNATNPIITSLEFTTNKGDKIGPFGIDKKGTPFSLALRRGSIVGFHGRNEQYLYSIGIFVAAWGSAPQGVAWSFDLQEGGYIKTIYIWSGEVVDAISFVAQTPDGRPKPSLKFGGDGGNQTQIEIEWPTEYLTSISGTYTRSYNVPDVITSLEFVTNLGRKFGPFGQKNGTTFAQTIKEGAIVGFHGRNTQYLNSINIFVRP